MICDNRQNKVPERDVLIPGSLNGWVSRKITFFEINNALTSKFERNAKVLVSVTMLRGYWICVASQRRRRWWRRRPLPAAIVAILLLIKHTVYHPGCCRNGLSVKTTSLLMFLLQVLRKRSTLMKHDMREPHVPPIDVFRSQLLFFARHNFFTLYNMDRDWC